MLYSIVQSLIMLILGGLGACPQENFENTYSEIESEAISECA